MSIIENEPWNFTNYEKSCETLNEHLTAKDMNHIKFAMRDKMYDNSYADIASKQLRDFLDKKYGNDFRSIRDKMRDNFTLLLNAGDYPSLFPETAKMKFFDGVKVLEQDQPMYADQPAQGLVTGHINFYHNKTMNQENDIRERLIENVKRYVNAKSPEELKNMQAQKPYDGANVLVYQRYFS